MNIRLCERIKYRKKLFRNGLPLEVPEEMELLVDAAADRLKLPVRQATYLKSFMVSGFDVKTCGMISISIPMKINEYSR